MKQDKGFWGKNKKYDPKIDGWALKLYNGTSKSWDQGGAQTRSSLPHHPGSTSGAVLNLVTSSSQPSQSLWVLPGLYLTKSLRVTSWVTASSPLNCTYLGPASLWVASEVPGQLRQLRIAKPSSDAFFYCRISPVFCSSCQKQPQLWRVSCTLPFNFFLSLVFVVFFSASFPLQSPYSNLFRLSFYVYFGFTLELHVFFYPTVYLPVC